MKNKQHKSGFNVPQGYFDTFTQRLLEKLPEKEANLPKYDGFSVPDGYFENLNERLHHRMKPAGGKVLSLQPYKKYFLAAAAVAAIIALFVTMPEKDVAQPSFDDLAAADIANYMENSELELTDAEIAEVFTLEELEMDDMLQSRLNEENIMEYLDRSMDDYEELNFGIDE